MNTLRNSCKFLFAAMAVLMGLQPLTVIAEDIDIFSSPRPDVGRPNVLIVLDNTANWARQAQQWPDGLEQGRSEVRAIKSVLNALPTDATGALYVNVGLMEYPTLGNSNNDGGFLRNRILWMQSADKATLIGKLDSIYANINDPSEKRASGVPYGNLFYDVRNYFAGDNVSLNGTNNTRGLYPPSPYVDAAGYTTAYSKFTTPLSSTNSCAKNYVIFITNPDQSGPSTDSTENKAALAGLSCSTTNIAVPNFASQTVATNVSVGNTTQCYANPTACTTAIKTSPSTEFGGNCWNGFYDAGTCACGAAASPTINCAAGSLVYTVAQTDLAGSAPVGYTAQCTLANKCTVASTTDYANYTADCTGTGVGCACNTAVKDPANPCAKSNEGRWGVTRSKSSTSVATRLTTACYPDLASCNATETATTTCSNLKRYVTGSGCACGAPTATTTSCASGNNYPVTAQTSEVVVAPDGTYNATKGAPWNLDEWASCLYQKGVPVAGGDNQSVATYTVDVYNKQQSADHTALMMSTAKVGGGKYYAATNEQALVTALTQIFQEITAVNSTFASASLPVNATNRAQNENQVFIGMFRPDSNSKPRWYGNLKRYQLIIGADGVSIELGDKDGQTAINNATGFVKDCAASWWTTDSPKNPGNLALGYYWDFAASAAGKCSSVTGTDKAFSDLPDGPNVEKGAVAEVIRKGNNPTGTDTNPTWAVSRTFYTTGNFDSTALLAGIASATSLTSISPLPPQQQWVSGQDTEDENLNASRTETRPSLHGDVVHSRPLPVNYGDKVVIYYGSNDGNFRAVNADSGKELWTLMPYEFAQPAFVDRLRLNSPLISYTLPNGTVTAGTPKDYSWDGSVAVLQNADNSKVWIYPAMRRGGRRIYALDVTSATTPVIKWIVGCNKDGTNCNGGFSEIGQTWSTPNLAPVGGYATEQVGFFGGGYDSCEDANTATPTCGAAKGRKVYAVDAGSGSQLWSGATDRSVPSDVALLDIDSDGKADYGYAADTGGNIYRIDMVKRLVAADGSVSYPSLPPASWTIRKIGTTSGGGRKFLFAPALFPVASVGKVYLAIGSGDREHPLISHYPYGGVTNRLYVLLDNLAVTAGAAVNLDTLDNKTTDLGCAATSIAPDSALNGWFMDLNAYGTGEQTVTSAIIAGGLIAFSTNRPIPAGTGTCDTPLGEARGYWVNLLSGSGAIGVDGNCGGTRSSTFVGGGLPPSPVIGTVPIGGTPRTVVIGAVQKSGGASTPISPQKVKPAISPTRKRVYWKQMGTD